MKKEELKENIKNMRIGEKRLQTLNVVNADLVDAYQMNGIENKSQNEDQMDVKELTGEKDNKEENP